jgi:ATPase subunit of ABC transporter with duplicated ATPase domains
VQNHLGAFGFSGDEVIREIGTLSGGERARMALAIMTLAHANLLVLDEPTNHLDVENIEALEDALEEYEGTVLLVSHDRAFLREVATRVWCVRRHAPRGLRRAVRGVGGDAEKAVARHEERVKAWRTSSPTPTSTTAHRERRTQGGPAGSGTHPRTQGARRRDGRVGRRGVRHKAR